MAFVHVPCRTDAIVTRPQFQCYVGLGFEAAAVEHLDVHVTEPFAANIKAEHVAAVRVFHRREWHLLRHMGQRETIVSEIFNIHVNRILSDAKITKIGERGKGLSLILKQPLRIPPQKLIRISGKLLIRSQRLPQPLQVAFQYGIRQVRIV